MEYDISVSIDPAAAICYIPMEHTLGCLRLKGLVMTKGWEILWHDNNGKHINEVANHCHLHSRGLHKTCNK
jgi:hypothetical protein